METDVVSLVRGYLWLHTDNALQWIKYKLPPEPHSQDIKHWSEFGTHSDIHINNIIIDMNTEPESCHDTNFVVTGQRRQSWHHDNVVITYGTKGRHCDNL